MDKALKAATAVAALLFGLASHGGEIGKTLSVGETGFDVKRPVLASACPNGCPWGELGSSFGMP